MVSDKTITINCNCNSVRIASLAAHTTVWLNAAASNSCCHISACVRDGLWRSEKIVKNLELRLPVSLLLQYYQDDIRDIHESINECSCHNGVLHMAIL